jgi:hypothetical protein
MPNSIFLPDSLPRLGVQRRAAVRGFAVDEGIRPPRQFSGIHCQSRPPGLGGE